MRRIILIMSAAITIGVLSQALVLDFLWGDTIVPFSGSWAACLLFIGIFLFMSVGTCLGLVADNWRRRAAGASHTWYWIAINSFVWGIVGAGLVNSALHLQALLARH